MEGKPTLYKQHNCREVVKSLNYRDYNIIVFKYYDTQDSSYYYDYVIKDKLGADVERGWVSKFEYALRTARNLIDDNIEIKEDFKRGK